MHLIYHNPVPQLQYDYVLVSMLKLYMVIFKYCSGLNTPPLWF